MTIDMEEHRSTQVLDKLPDTATPLTIGDTVHKGDYMRIHETYTRMEVCKYDPGCCTDRKVTERNRFWRLK